MSQSTQLSVPLVNCCKNWGQALQPIANNLPTDTEYIDLLEQRFIASEATINTLKAENKHYVAQIRDLEEQIAILKQYNAEYKASLADYELLKMRYASTATLLQFASQRIKDLENRPVSHTHKAPVSTRWQDSLMDQFGPKPLARSFAHFFKTIVEGKNPFLLKNAPPEFQIVKVKR